MSEMNFNDMMNMISKMDKKELEEKMNQVSKMLGNMNTMYDHSLLSDYISAKDFNRMVEKDLFEYIKL